MTVPTRAKPGGILAYGMVAAAMLIGATLTPAHATTNEDLGQLEQQAFQAAVDRVAPSVVRIETVGGLQRAEGVLLGTGPTTGLVVDSEGYIISSAFNFLNRPASILVHLPEGTRKPARLVATDHNRMLVLLKIDAQRPLPVPEIVPAGQMQVGQWAIAVGRAFEVDRPNMSVGILSAQGRIWGKAVQTDAAVSPNNYGGPLVDVRGRVLGVLAPLSPQSDSEVSGVEWYDSGIGFAVPAEHVQSVLQRLKRGEDLYPGLLGISFRSRNLHMEEPVIRACHPKSPAQLAGLKQGDKIVEIDGRKIDRAAQVKEEISRRYAGQKIRLAVLRDRQRIEREIELAAALAPYEHPLLGILPMRAGGGAQRPAGVAVRYVYPEGPAAAAGIRPGDVLVSLADRPIQDPDDLLQQLSALEPDDEVRLEVRRGSQTLRPTLRLGRLPERLPPEELPPAREDVRPGAGERPQVGMFQLKIPELPNDAWAYVPEGYDPAVAHGVVVWLQAPGGFDPQELAARWKPFCDRCDLILLAPKAADPAKWQDGEAALVGKLLEEIGSGYTLDPARIVVHGHEGGGSLAYLVAFQNRELVRAVAAVDASPAGQPPENDPLHRLAFYVASSENHRSAGLIRQTVARLREMKYPVTMKNLGLGPRYLDSGELAELVRWIDMLDRI